ncbi:MAG: flagellar biosynthesis protein FlgA [Candidatus Goldiibacteriota bacterium HGW-Goldbacteria-1]|jgi:flagellar P-ring protein precursor FlgI|nr:MAG: flagellar biosynthesis protein FlgA [Candidatus Goldiibacteriota bacterium HGW-Goldbacteria-1]
MKKLLKPVLMILLFALIATSLLAVELRVRNIARFKGVRDNQLTGFGLVVGLKGTGDRQTTVFTNQAVTNMLKRFGINDPSEQIKIRNVAAVMVTAQLPPFAKKGDKIDVVVSSMGDAKSLEGGILLQTVMKGADEKIYVTGQGPVSTGTGGMNVNPGISATKQTVGRVPNGGAVEREVPVTFMDDKNDMYLLLTIPDFTTASRVTDILNSQFWSTETGTTVANAVDAGTIKVHVPFDFQNNPVEFAAAVEGLYVEIEERSDKVVINERTGTVVMGADVAIDTCAVAHGVFNVNINVVKQISQPAQYLPGASAMEYENSNIKVEGAGNQLISLPQGVDVLDLVNALNTLGASPKDIISILQAIKAANALHGTLEIL